MLTNQDDDTKDPQPELEAEAEQERDLGETAVGVIEIDEEEFAEALKKYETKPLKRYNVVLLDDTDHTHDYVENMVVSVCGKTADEAKEIAKQVHEDGRAVVFSGHLEVCELKRLQIETYGGDEVAVENAGAECCSMTAFVQPE